jgi:chemotaxis protein histidine kinase CheA
MIVLHQVDRIVLGTLYDHGLQFSYDWATPYWRLMQIGFVLGWINIAAAIIVQANKIRMKRKADQPVNAIEEAWKTARSPETKEGSKESAKEQEETEPAKPAEEKPTAAPQPEPQEKKEEPQAPEKTPEKEPQLPENEPEEIPSLSGLFPELPPTQT